MATKLPEVLYHYCSLDTFLEIMKSSQLWLSDIRKSNDSLEIKWVLGKCHSLITDKLSTCPIDSYFSTISMKDKIKTPSLPLDFSRLQKLTAFDVFYMSQYKINSAWCFCFSSKQDSLDQWRGYANDGCGIAIGFRRKYLEQINYARLPSESQLTCKLSQVDYKASDEELSKVLGINNIDPNISYHENSLIADNAKKLALGLPPIYKNPSFAEEKEWRLFIQANLPQGNIYDETLLLDKPKIFHEYFEINPRGFYHRQNKIVSYIPLYITRMRDALAELIIGPKADVEEFDVLKVLNQYGYIDTGRDSPIQIKRSTLSYC